MFDTCQKQNKTSQDSCTERSKRNHESLVGRSFGISRESPRSPVALHLLLGTWSPYSALRRFSPFASSLEFVQADSESEVGVFFLLLWSGIRFVFRLLLIWLQMLMRFWTGMDRAGGEWLLVVLLSHIMVATRRYFLQESACSLFNWH